MSAPDAADERTSTDDQASSANPASTSTWSILRRFSSEKVGITTSFVLSVASTAAEAGGLVLLVSLATTFAAGSSSAQKALGPIQVQLDRNLLGALTATLIVASVLLTLVANSVRSRSTVRWVEHKRRAVADDFMRSSWQLQAQERAGRLQTYSSYVDQAALVLSSVFTAGRGLLGVTLLLVTAIVINPPAAVLVVVLGGGLFAIIRPITGVVRARSRHQSLMRQRYDVDLGEVLDLGREIKVFGTTDQFSHRVSGSIQDLATAETKVYWLSWAVAPIYQGAAMLIIIAAIALLSRLSSVEPAAVGAVALLVLRSVSYGQQFQLSHHALHAGAPSLELLDEALDLMRASQPVFGSVEVDRIETISLRSVSLTYPGERAPALSDIDLELHRGEMLAMVGPSGSGKSTLAQVLLRLRPADDGDYLVDGAPADDYATDSWTRAVSLVPQETRLVHGSVFDNIAFFRPWIDRDDVERASRAAGLHDTILALDDGYDTALGRGSRDLSGGQMQRIGIARALAGRPSLLVLDEPTSALDHRTEQIIKDTIERVRADMIVVVIAHRLSTVDTCDRMLVLDRGRVEFLGDPHEASNLSGFLGSISSDTTPPAEHPDLVATDPRSPDGPADEAPTIDGESAGRRAG